MSEGRTIGRGERRRDGQKLATGRGTFTDDVALRGALHAFVLTSPHAHARILHVDATVARAMPGVAAVLTHEDLPRPAGGGEADAILSSEVRYIGDAVALVAALDLDLARRAAESIEVQYETLPAILDLAAATAQASPELAIELRAEVGALETALAESKDVLVRTYHCPRVAQAAVEPQAAVAWIDEDQRLVVRTSSHVPFYVRQVLARRLGLPARRIRILAPRDGGGFGSRVGVEIEDRCAALAHATGKPVRLARTREQEMIGARSGHEQTITIRSAVRDGALVALDMIVVENAGAAVAPEWAAAALRTAGGSLSLYRCPNVRFHGRAFMTHLPPAGALRGDGAAQALFALESHIDELAATIGEDPLEFRRRHHVREGDTLPIVTALSVGAAAEHTVPVRSCGLPKAIEDGARAIGWSGLHRPPSSSEHRRGLGVALVMQAPGPVGAEMSAATVDMLEDGSFHLFVGTSNIGAGTETVLCQIAAEVLGVPLESVEPHAADTDVVPFASGPARASALYVSGLAVRDAARDVRDRIHTRAAQILGADKDDVVLRDGQAFVMGGRSIGYDDIARSALMGQEPTPISSTASYAIEDAPPSPYGAVFVEVEVDTATGLVRVLKIVEAIDCGRVLNPQIAEARIEGGALQGMGHALSESVTFDADGRCRERSFREYRIVTASDAPKVEALLIPTEEPTGPFGAKSIGELPIYGVGPAIANAIAQATGARVRDLPLLPERVLSAIVGARER